MWSNVISIDKLYKREFDYLFNIVKKSKTISYAFEESRDRYFLYIAALCENSDEARSTVEQALIHVYLTYFKLSVFLKNIKHEKLSHAMVALLSSLLAFDRSFEETVILKTLSDTIDYNVDAIFNFRLSALRENWTELAQLCNNLLSTAIDENDVYNVASFITSDEGGKNKLMITHDEAPVIKNLTENKEVEIEDIFDNDELNILLAAVKESPKEIIIKDTGLSKDMWGALSRITSVREVNNLKYYE